MTATQRHLIGLGGFLGMTGVMLAALGSHGADGRLLTNAATMCLAHAPAGRQAKLGQLGGLAGSGLSADDDNRMAADRLDDRLAMGRNRQGIDQLAQRGGDRAGRGLARRAVRRSGFAQSAEILAGGGNRRVHDKIIMFGT